MCLPISRGTIFTDISVITLLLYSFKIFCYLYSCLSRAFPQRHECLSFYVVSCNSNMQQYKNKVAISNKHANNLYYLHTCYPSFIPQIAFFHIYSYTINETHHKNLLFAYAKTKAQDSCKVSMQLISTFVFAA